MSNAVREFLSFQDNWFFKRYAALVGERFWSFKVALGIAAQHGARTLVETGSFRNWENGGSTVLLAHAAKILGARLWSVDKDPQATERARKETEEFKDAVTCVNMDSVEFLGKMDHPIDLLYLDSMDVDGTDGPAAHALRELMAAWPRLSPHAVVLVDDNYWPGGTGKTSRVKELLCEKGWLCVMDFGQTLWLRQES